MGFNVKVKEGQEEEFQKQRDRFITLARNTNNIEKVAKFTVNRDIMQPDDPLFFDHTRDTEEIKQDPIHHAVVAEMLDGRRQMREKMMENKRMYKEQDQVHKSVTKNMVPVTAFDYVKKHGAVEALRSLPNVR